MALGIFTSISISGLDSTQTDGVEGFTSLEEATYTLSTLERKLFNKEKR